jgi:PPK2 family polyphosphate:nucleotide phosphotransferase
MADRRVKRLREFIEPFRVPPGKKVVLARDFDPSYKDDVLNKSEGEELLKEGIEQLSEFQARLAAQDTYSVLVCLQALDAAGKDGTIRHVMSGVNPQGVEVHGFKVPSSEELDHDYLWRYQKSLPRRGNIGIFNRSHYEEVLVVRVHDAILANEQLPKAARTSGIWSRRYRAINDWERHLVENGYRVVKLFLNLSNEEQRRRFLARIDEPDKNWKFSAGDARERQYWDAYQKAFSEMLSATSTEWAPWYVIPADHKWFARIAAGAVIIETLMTIDPQYPVLSQEAIDDLQQVKKELEAEAPDGVAPDPVEEELEKEARKAARDKARADDDPPAKHKKDKKGGKKAKKK